MPAKTSPTAPNPEIAGPVAGPSKVPLILLSLMVVGNLAGTAFIALRLLHPDAPKGAEQAAEKEKKAAAPGPVVPIESFVVNLNEPGSSRYLKTTFEIEVENAAVQKDVEERRRNLRDEVLRYLSNLTVKETMGEAGKSKIKDELLWRADHAVGGGHKVKNLFLTEFVVQ